MFEVLQELNWALLAVASGGGILLLLALYWLVAPDPDTPAMDIEREQLWRASMLIAAFCVVLAAAGLMGMKSSDPCCASSDSARLEAHIQQAEQQRIADQQLHTEMLRLLGQGGAGGAEGEAGALLDPRVDDLGRRVEALEREPMPPPRPVDWTIFGIAGVLLLIGLGLIFVGVITRPWVNVGSAALVGSGALLSIASLISMENSVSFHDPNFTLIRNLWNRNVYEGGVEGGGERAAPGQLSGRLQCFPQQTIGTFDDGSSEHLVEGARPLEDQLDALALAVETAARQNQVLTLYVIGSTDRRGYSRGNATLARERAIFIGEQLPRHLGVTPAIPVEVFHDDVPFARMVIDDLERDTGKTVMACALIAAR